MNDCDSVADESDKSVLDLDIKEINELEFDIPYIAPPPLESILWDVESEEGSDCASLQSFQSASYTTHYMLFNSVLDGITTQINSAAERVNAGLPTVITYSFKYIAIGTSHGYILNFDPEQVLCWCCTDATASDEGAISALAFNLDCTRLLVGYERGYILMIDAGNGDVIRRLPDAHAPMSSVIHLKFTFLNGLALSGDSAGCIFSMTFGRRLGVRTWDSKCLFSGATGEVCVLEPLTQSYDLQFLTHNVIVALATMSKVIIISIRPQIKCIYSKLLPKISTALPLINWQLVAIGRSMQPVLAWGRGNELNFSRLIIPESSSKKIRVATLRTIQLGYSLTSLHWLGTEHLGILDSSENLRLMEVRSQKELEVLELANVELVYSSAHFKALAVGGGVSEAFALAGERACYNTMCSRGDQILLLGTKAVHMIKLRSWPERLLYLSDQGHWNEALNLAAEGGSRTERISSAMLLKFIESMSRGVDRENLVAAINCCVKLDKNNILCNDLWESCSCDPTILDWYFTTITDHIISGALTSLSPSVAQNLVNYLEKKNIQILENVLLALDISCIDIHQAIKICKKYKLYNAWIHITTKTIGDYTSPLTEFLSELTPSNQKLGNTMLVYVSSCLAGLGYPSGNIPKEDILRVKHEILRCLETLHSIHYSKNEKTYPYLRALLKYNMRECLNVVNLAFSEAEFTGEMGLLQRQRLVQILMQIIMPDEFSENEIMTLATFICRLVTSNNLDLEESIMEKVFKTLTSKNNESLSLREHLEREQSWLDLLISNKLKNISYEEHLNLSLESKCYKVAEYLLESKKDYSTMFSCYLNDKTRKHEIFNYISIHIHDSQRLIHQQFLVNFKELIEIDTAKTAKLVLEHFVDKIDNLCSELENEKEVQFKFLTELVIADIKLSPDLYETFLELLCQKNENQVKNYIQSGVCRLEKALEITKKYKIHEATALLLEQAGEWLKALELLLQHDFIEDALGLCLRGAEHLDTEGAQRLWMILLEHNKENNSLLLRQVIRSTAHHMPPHQLLEWVMSAKFDDIKNLVEKMLSDYKNDVEIFETVLKVTSTDVHQGLVRSLSNNGRGISISDRSCTFCHQSLTVSNAKSQTIVICGCGFCFHEKCIQDESNCCQNCDSSRLSLLKKRLDYSSLVEQNTHSRPNLEGLF